MGVATGITMEFQFGTNWAYYSHYVGDIFGAPLAIEGLMAFFLESTFVGLFFFGWDRLSKVGHLIVTWLVAIGSNLSALWILIANGWMQNPVGAKFNPDTMRMELSSFYDLLFNPGRAVEVRAHRQRGLRLRIAVRPGDFLLVSAARASPGLRQALADRRFGLRTGFVAVRRRPGRRERLQREREPEDEARRDRGDVEHRAVAGRLHLCSGFPMWRRKSITSKSRSPGFSD